MSFINTITGKVSTVGKVIKKSFGPLAVLEEDYRNRSPIGSNGVLSDLRYPLDVGSPERYPHTVQFQTWLPTPLKIVSDDPKEATITTTKGEGIGSQIKGLFGSVADKVETRGLPQEAYDGIQMKVNRNQAFNSRILDFSRRATISDLITMYSPVSWMDRHNNAYNEQSITAAFGAVGAVIEATSSLMDAYKSEADWRTNLGNMVNKAGDLANGPMGMEAAGAVAGAFGMDGGVIRDAGLTALGYAMNPQFEMLYGGTNLREFQFDFTMTPRNQKEAEMILQVIRTFKWHASPQYVLTQGRYIIPPSYFDITFKFNGAESPWLPYISTCILKSIDVDYSGGVDQWATHKDGAPVQTKMTLIFGEMEMMHKKLREIGY